MSEEDRRKWDERYRSGAYLERTHPSVLLEEWLDRLPGGRALDVACGAGRNALYLATAGYEVDAVDISTAALERARQTAEELGVDIQWYARDLEHEPLPEGSYALIVWIRYANPRLLGEIAAKLSPGGCLVCEQHLASEEDVISPKQPRFRVRSGELLKAAAGLGIRAYREGIVRDPDGRRTALAQLVACREA